MRVDQATLRDLSILEPGEDGISLFALLDRTRTSLGRSALRVRLRALPNGEDLQRTQDAVRHLASRLDAATSAIEAADPDAVDAYLSLKWQAQTKRSITGRFVERVALRWMFRDAVRQISEGVGHVRNLLEGLDRVRATLIPGPELLEGYAWRLRELADAAVLVDVRRYATAGSLTNILQADFYARGRARHDIREIVAILSDLDALCSLARATVEQQWCFPEIIHGDGVMEVAGLRHPFLAAGIANDITLSGRRVLAVTGPNMAGKSTLLKAVGLGVYLAHLGCGVPATRARLSRFDAMMSSLFIRDSLSSGQSFYLSEVRRIRDLISLLESCPRACAILDEPFKGTNVRDATEATTLLLDGLCAQASSTVIVATHLAAVVRSRLQDPCLAAVFLGASEDASGLAFDYQLRAGVSDQRLGMVLLELEGVAPALLAAIERRAQRFGSSTLTP